MCIRDRFLCVLFANQCFQHLSSWVEKVGETENRNFSTEEITALLRVLNILILRFNFSKVGFLASHFAFWSTMFYKKKIFLQPKIYGRRKQTIAFFFFVTMPLSVCRKQADQQCDNKLAELAEMREELQRQVDELRRAAVPLRSSIGDTDTTLIRQKSEVSAFYSMQILGTFSTLAPVLFISNFMSATDWRFHWCNQAVSSVTEQTTLRDPKIIVVSSVL